MFYLNLKRILLLVQNTFPTKLKFDSRLSRLQLFVLSRDLQKLNPAYFGNVMSDVFHGSSFHSLLHLRYLRSPGSVCCR
jgi:hypothetical protein